MSAQNKAIYQAFLDDPHLHLRTDLGPHYRAGVLGIKRPSDPKHRAAWNAGRDAAASGVKLDLPPALAAIAKATGAQS
jgi:hypothetical protein